MSDIKARLNRQPTVLEFGPKGDGTDHCATFTRALATYTPVLIAPST